MFFVSMVHPPRTTQRSCATLSIATCHHGAVLTPLGDRLGRPTVSLNGGARLRKIIPKRLLGQLRRLDNS